MNCRDSESLILSERDGALTNEQRASLSDHVQACPHCQQFRLDLTAALDLYQADAAAVSVPEVEQAWRDLRTQIHAGSNSAQKRPLAPVLWFAAPLAAAAALAFAFIAQRPVAPLPGAPMVASIPPPPPPPMHDPSVIAGADFVEAGDPNASTIVYVDAESGWLVVWATDDASNPASRG